MNVRATMLLTLLAGMPAVACTSSSTGGGGDAGDDGHAALDDDGGVDTGPSGPAVDLIWYVTASPDSYLTSTIIRCAGEVSDKLRNENGWNLQIGGAFYGTFPVRPYGYPGYELAGVLCPVGTESDDIGECLARKPRQRLYNFEGGPIDPQTGAYVALAALMSGISFEPLVRDLVCTTPGRELAPCFRPRSVRLVLMEAVDCPYSRPRGTWCGDDHLQYDDAVLGVRTPPYEEIVEMLIRAQVGVLALANHDGGSELFRGFFPEVYLARDSGAVGPEERGVFRLRPLDIPCSDVLPEQFYAAVRLYVERRLAGD